MIINSLPSSTRLLAKPTSGREFEGGSERRTGVYVSVHEDLSTAPTHKLPAEAGFGKKSTVSQEKLKEVAKEFETMFLTHVLESVFSNIPDSSHESAMFKSFWAEAVAKSASQKSFGIADMVFKCLVKQQSNGQLELAQMKRSYSIQNPQQGGYYA